MFGWKTNLSETGLGKFSPGGLVGAWLSTGLLVAPVFGSRCGVRVFWMGRSLAKNITGLGDIGKPVFGLLDICGPEDLFEAFFSVDAINNVGRFPFHDPRPKTNNVSKGNIVQLRIEH